MKIRAAVLEQFGARGAQHQDPGATREIDHVIEHLDQHRLAPLEVVHVQDQRSLRGERFQQLPHLQKQLLRAVKAFMDKGILPPGRDPEHQRVRSAAVVLPPDQPFKDAAKDALIAKAGVAHASV